VIAAAGELAIKWKIVLWKPGAARAAAAECFKDWRALRGGSGSAETIEAIRQVVTFFQRHAADRFDPMDNDIITDDGQRRFPVRDRMGFTEYETLKHTHCPHGQVSCDENHSHCKDTEHSLCFEGEKRQHWYCQTEQWKEICAPYNHLTTVRELARLGAVEPNPDKPDELLYVKWLPGLRSKRIYHINDKIFDLLDANAVPATLSTAELEPGTHLKSRKGRKGVRKR
jgi:hypothetical protein